jgi:hypothetical protein
MARHTIRGRVGPGATKRLIMDDGMFTQGHKVTNLQIIGANNGTIESTAVLSYSDAIVPQINFDDSNQFAWVFWDNDTTNGSRQHLVLDPDHAVLQDLFIHAVGGGCDYLLTIEPITLTEPQGVLQLIKHKRQG